MLQPIQTQPFTIYGNGVLIGDTSMTLASFNDINGVALTITPFGTVGTGTVEPGAGTNEEQIIFTSVTTNANMTVTLGGVSSVAFQSPYTLTSGFTKSHFGGTTFVLSDTAYLFSQYANLGASNTFTGTNTFAIAPFIPTVASSATSQAASVGYANALAIAGSPKASNTVIGITQLSVAPVTASTPIAVGINDPLVSPVSLASLTAGAVAALIGDGGLPSGTNTFVTQAGSQNGSESFAVTTGSSVAYAISLSPIPVSYIKGERIFFQTNVASGSSPTINKNSLGAKSLYKQTTTGTAVLSIGDLGTNQMNAAEYDGGAYQLLSPVSSATNFKGLFTNGTFSKNSGDASTTQNIAHGLGVVPKYIKLELGYQNSGAGASLGFYAKAIYNGSTQSSLSFWQSDGTGVAVTTNNSFTLNGFAGTGQTQVGVVTADATNIIITWTKTGSPTGIYAGIWEAEA